MAGNYIIFENWPDISTKQWLLDEKAAKVIREVRELIEINKTFPNHTDAQKARIMGLKLTTYRSRKRKYAEYINNGGVPNVSKKDKR